MSRLVADAPQPFQTPLFTTMPSASERARKRRSATRSPELPSSDRADRVGLSFSALSGGGDGGGDNAHVCRRPCVERHSVRGGGGGKHGARESLLLRSSLPAPSWPLPAQLVLVSARHRRRRRRHQPPLDPLLGAALWARASARSRVSLASVLPDRLYCAHMTFPAQRVPPPSCKLPEATCQIKNLINIKN